jgi:hypothetical protein
LSELDGGLLTHFDETRQTGRITYGARSAVPSTRLDLREEEANDIIN